MTNQQWLATLSPEDWWDVVHRWLLNYHCEKYTVTELAAIDWLKKEFHGDPRFAESVISHVEIQNR